MLATLEVTSDSNTTGSLFLETRENEKNSGSDAKSGLVSEFDNSMRNTYINRRPYLSLLTLCLTMLQAGCTLLTTSQLPFVGAKKPEFESPRQVVPVWSDTVLHQPDSAATRGFGGRLMFYGQDKHKPIRVEGSLIVYAWDDSKGSMERAPDRKYVFPAETFQNHYSESRLGHSYSFWVPWDAAGGPLQRLTLISRFLSKEGTELTGAPAHVVLQGPSDSSPFPNEIEDANSVSEEDGADPGLSARLEKKRMSRIQQAGYLREEESSFPSGRSYPSPTHPGLRTTEIGLTRGFYERNMQGNQAAKEMREFTATDVDDLLSASPTKQTKKSSRGDSIAPARGNTSATLENEDDAEVAEESDPQSVDFPPFESRVRTSRVVGSSVGPVRRQPLPAKSLNGLPATPRSSANAIE